MAGSIEDEAAEPGKRGEEADGGRVDGDQAEGREPRSGYREVSPRAKEARRNRAVRTEAHKDGDGDVEVLP